MKLVQLFRGNHHYLPILLLLLAGVFSGCQSAPSNEQPNIILIVADDLGYGDLGAYGQQAIQTPVLDQMARDGIIFTNFYAGATVCAPSRSTLMTGRHNGHNQIRGNREVRPMGQQPLTDETVTLAEVLQDAGYRTGLIGKWGLGGPDSEGEPNNQGFDYFFGYLGQRHAHNYYPEFLFRNQERVLLPGNKIPEPQRGDGSGHAIEKVTYSHDVIANEALSFIAEESEQPYFLLLTITIPHANNEAGDEGMEVPDYESYVDESWPEPQKGLASMITRMDRDVGRLIKQINSSGDANNTLILFTSDNGPHAEGGNNPDYFDSNGPLRGKKRDLYEGGIRVPLIAYWPGKIAAGSSTDHMSYFGDFYTTLAEIAGTELENADELDSISLTSSLLGSGNQTSHEYLYWEFYEQGSRQAVRKDNWKAVRQPMHEGPIELYNLDMDLSETTDVAGEHPEIVDEMRSLMEEAHIPNPDWTVR